MSLIESIPKSPNHALQRTAPHVTAAASSLRLATTVQPPRRAPLSLSLRALDVATRTMRVALLLLLFASSPVLIIAAAPSKNMLRYQELKGEAAAPYAAKCRDAFSRAMTREDISARGPVVYRDRQTNQILAHYTVGFMGLFVVAFDQRIPPKVTETYFTDFERKTKYERLPDLLSDVVADLHKQGILK